MKWFVWHRSFLLLLAVASPAYGEGFGWRGDGTGRFPDAHPPVQWDIDEGKNILWQTKVGKGQSTPVVAAGRIFVTAEQDLLLCLDRSSGKVLWTKDNGYAALPPDIKTPVKRPPTSPNCGYSTPTPVADDKLVYVCYGTGIVVCYDRDGNRRWIRYLDLPQLTQYGRSVSPLLAAGRLLVSTSSFVALDPRTGETVWHTEEAKPAYGTPAVATIGKVSVALTPNGDCVRLSDGAVLATKLAKTVYTSPIVHAGVVYYADAPAVAIRLNEKDDAAVQVEKLWENDALEGEFFASPLYHEGIVYCASNEGIFYALDSASGKIVFQQELAIASASGKPGSEPANIYPSLTLAGRHLMVGNDAGEMLLLKPSRQYIEVARNYLDKGCGASPVPDGELLFIRGGDTQYCIGP